MIIDRISTTVIKMNFRLKNSKSVQKNNIPETAISTFT